MKKRIWPEEVERMLRERYPTEGAVPLAQELGLTPRMVRKHMAALGVLCLDRKPWSPQEDDRMRKEYHTVGPEKLAQMFGRSINSVWHRARQLGVRDKKYSGRAGRTRWSEADDNAIREIYPTQGPLPLVDILRVSAVTLRYRAHKLGIESPNYHDRLAVSLRALNFSVDHEYFLKPMTPNQAWLLGYLASDGCIDQEKGVLWGISFSCITTDSYLLEAIKQEIQATREIKHAIRKKINKPLSSQSTLRINSQPLAQSLVDKWGIVPRKSFCDPPFLGNVPDKFFGHFARGLLDGDGCIHIRKEPHHGNACIGFTGSHDFLTGFTEQLVRVANVRFHPVRKQIGCSNVTWSALTDMVNLYHTLYPQGDYIYLRRKREKLEQFLKMKGEL